MKPRVDPMKYSTSSLGRAILALQKEVEATGLEKSLLELIKIRASQINGCAYCIDMHTKDARARGETEQRIYALNAWREAPFFTERERAALDWVEQITLIAAEHVPDDAWDRVCQQFNETEVVALTFAAATINVWNRLAISFRAPVGTYKPHAVTA